MGAGHDHSHTDARVSRMLIAAAILTGFFAVELTTAVVINSIALLADAGHLLTDLAAIFMGLTAVLLTTHWPYADVVVAVFVALWVLPRAFSLAAAALRILSEASPRHIDVKELRSALCAVDSVTEVHDLHVWTLAPGKDMVTAHLTNGGDSARVLDDARAVLAARGLDHATVQVEPPDGAGDCSASW